MWNEIKKIITKTKGTCVIIEDGRPAYVVSPFKDDQADGECCCEKKEIGKSSSEQELLEKINQDIINWKTEQASESPEIGLAEGQDDGELKIENLTF